MGDGVDHGFHMGLFILEEVICALNLGMGDGDALLFMQLGDQLARR